MNNACWKNIGAKNGSFAKIKQLPNLENHSWPCKAEKNEETIAIVGSFDSNYLFDWLDIFFGLLTLLFWVPTIFEFPSTVPAQIIDAAYNHELCFWPLDYHIKST